MESIELDDFPGFARSDNLAELINNVTGVIRVFQIAFQFFNALLFVVAAKFGGVFEAKYGVPTSRRSRSYKFKKSYAENAVLMNHLCSQKCGNAVCCASQSTENLAISCFHMEMSMKALRFSQKRFPKHLVV